MKCPACKDQPLKVIPANFGAVIDGCEHCKGIWLDRGEIYLFSKNPKKLAQVLSSNFPKLRNSHRRCPRCNINMETHQFIIPNLEVELCPKCAGLWFDKGELSKVKEIDKRLFMPKNVQLKLSQKRARRLSPQKISIKPYRLPNLFIRSIWTLTLLYAILGAVLITAVEFGKILPQQALIIIIAIVGLQYIISPFLMGIMLSFLYDFSWKKYEELPLDIATYIKNLTKLNNMKPPKIGILNDGAPTAFTFGHTPNNMRIIISRGIFELLDPDEIKAVLAHEVGHGKHWDMALMTIANVVPMILYYCYRLLIGKGSRRRSSAKGGGASSQLLIIAIISYVLYIITEYIVLWFSRTREYHADRFSGISTRNPNALSSALMKIAYGLSAKTYAPSDSTLTSKKEKNNIDIIGPMGIFDPKSAQALVISSIPSGNGQNSNDLKKAMQWDMWNPWALFYELNSTHPLIAKRMIHLSNLAESMGQKPFIKFDLKQPESYWDEFIIDIIIKFLPVIMFLLGILLINSSLNLHVNKVKVINNIGFPIFFAGIGLLIKSMFLYKKSFFPTMSIASLLHKVKVSSVRPVCAKLRGTIIGKGIPGLIWSEDFILQDDSGILFLDYKQPFKIWDFLFGLLKAGQFTDKQVEVIGWFKRAPLPYLEIFQITDLSNNEKTISKVSSVSYLMALILMIIGLFLMMK